MDRLVSWFSGQWATLGPSQKVSFVAIGLGLVATSIIAGTMLMTPDWEVLYGGLSPQDTGEMRAKLSDLGIQSRVSKSGMVIEVPSAEVGRARIELAGAGLPKEGAGLEVLKNPPLGATQENLKDLRQMALQDELSKTFRALDPVRYASVSLVLPEEGLFAAQNREASAVVVIGLRPGATLDSRQIAGMTHILTRSVPELKPENVSITDTSRGLLAIGSDYASGSSGYGGPLSEMEEARQKSYEKQVQGMLDAAFGVGNSRVAVHLEMDLTKRDVKKTVHTPSGAPSGTGTFDQKTARGSGDTETTSTTQPLINEQSTTERTAPDGSKQMTQNNRTFGPFNTEETTEVVPPGQVKGTSVSIILDTAIAKPKESSSEGEEGEEKPAELTPAELARKMEDIKRTAQDIAIAALMLKVPPVGAAEADLAQYPDRVTVSAVDFDRSAMMAMEAEETEAAGIAKKSQYVLYGKYALLVLLAFVVYKIFAKKVASGLNSIERYGGMASVGAVSASSAGRAAAGEGAGGRAASETPSFEDAGDKELDAITAFAKQRPDTVALLLKSWLVEGPKR